MTTQPVRMDSAELVQEDHLALRERLRLVQAALARPNSSPADLWQDLRALELELAEHFRHEETDGFFTSIVESAPQLHEQIVILIQQHERFRMDIGLMKEVCRVVTFAPDQLTVLAAWYAEFVQALDAHEHAELRLVQESLNRDMGAAD